MLEVLNHTPTIEADADRLYLVVALAAGHRPADVQERLQVIARTKRIRRTWRKEPPRVCAELAPRPATQRVALPS